MTQDDSFAMLMSRLRGGDDDAAAAVFARFTQRLIALARSRLNDDVRRKVDPEDVLQSVYESFFLRQREGQFDLANWDSLWGLLTLLTIRKCANRVAHFHADCRDVRREVAAEPDQSSPDVWQAMADDPTPSAAVALTETVEQLMQGLEARDREILALHLQGYTMIEISGRINRAQRTVRRVLERVRRRLERLRSECEATA